MEKLLCKVSAILFENKAMGFYILKAIPEGKHKEVAIKGTFPGQIISVGFRIEVIGEWIQDPKWGQQFRAELCEVIIEKGRNGTVSYLISHVPSIGPVTAAKLYDALGEDLLKTLEEKPDVIRTLAFLNKNQADSIISEWSQASENRTTSIFLSDLGLNPHQIKGVFHTFGPKAKVIINEDPYSLSECPGVGFLTADNAARELGIGINDIRRCKAIIMFAMRELSTGDGHVYVTTPQIKDTIRRLFKKHGLEPFSSGEIINDTVYYSCLTSLIEADKIYTEGEAVYLKGNKVFEYEAAECVTDIINQPIPDLGDLTEILRTFEKERGLVLSDDQREAFMLLNKSRICAISGYPGTGKTLLISAIVYLFDSLKMDYALLSPTGIAAKRLSQMTGKPAYTIHRALGFKENQWDFNRNNKYVVDAIVVDEMSMVDSSVFYRLMTALREDTIVIFVGDAAQLPSVGAGQVLKSLLNCPDVPHVSLTQIYRQEDKSDIIKVAHQILQGEMVDTRLKEKSDFIFLNYSSNIVAEICALSKDLKARDANFQVLAPMYDGELGVNNLNEQLRIVLNSDYIASKSIAKIKIGTTEMYEGDRVMVVKNDYKRMIYNGDTGKVQKISFRDGEVEVKIWSWFDHDSPVPRYVDKVFTFTVEEARSMLKVAYASTVHRCQGLEYDYIIMPMTSQYGPMLYRNLIYTAITRAKKKVFMLGDPKALFHSIMNNREVSRNTNLNALISRFLQERISTVTSPSTQEVEVTGAEA